MSELQNKRRAVVSAIVAALNTPEGRQALEAVNDLIAASDAVSEAMSECSREMLFQEYCDKPSEDEVVQHMYNAAKRGNEALADIAQSVAMSLTVRMYGWELEVKSGSGPINYSPRN